MLVGVGKMHEPYFKLFLVPVWWNESRQVAELVRVTGRGIVACVQKLT
jgi:hypothetical protein